MNKRNIFAIYKPKGPTSHDVVDEVRKITGVKKVGHAGTLDPLAEGVLVIGVGREATRQLNEILQKEKEYVAEIKFGETSTTDDEEGEKGAVSDRQPSLGEINKTISKFLGVIEQASPAYSAAKRQGQKAYEFARRGEKVPLARRQVEVKEIEVLDYNYPILKIHFVTGSGVYIRSLARDVGGQLGVGGYLASLVRTRVGEFSLEKAIKLEQLSEYLN